MFDWKAKITRLLELPGLTDDERRGLEDHLLWHSPSNDPRLNPFPFPERVLERSIQSFLEELTEARGYGWTMQCDRQKRTQISAYRVEIWRNNVDNYGVRSIATGSAGTPAQALCDAVLASLEEAPHD